MKLIDFSKFSSKCEAEENKDQLQTMYMREDQLQIKYREPLERCVLCASITTVPVSAPEYERSFYVEGAGQLCENCYRQLYGDIDLRTLGEL